MKTSDIESLIGKTVTIDKGQKKLENGELAWKWDFSLSDEGDFDNGKRGFFTTMKSDYVAIEILGLYWHFVDLVWVFIFAFFYLW